MNLPLSIPDRPDQTPLQALSESIEHVWRSEDWDAIVAALVANRPLLLRGEPGTGKTQVAYAAAAELNRPVLSFTVDARTEARDLLWTFDPVLRLAEAQVAPVIHGNDSAKIREALRPENFVQPGRMWWALDWEDAKTRSNQFLSATAGVAPGAAAADTTVPATPDGWTPEQGVVVLIDEIDKAGTDVPNGLLEILGMQEFTPFGSLRKVQLKAGTAAPLIVITTNEDRPLPDAFLRRCVVHQIQLPECAGDNGSKPDNETRQRFVDYLVPRGSAHFGKLAAAHPDLIRMAAEWLMDDRRAAINGGEFLKPGQAEFIDMLRAMERLRTQQQSPTDWAERLRKLIFRKAVGVPR